MAVNYDDKRFQNVESQEKQALSSANNMYNNMINNSDNYYNQMAVAAENYGKQQAEIQQANTDFAIEKIEQQKEQAEKDYTREQKGAYADWQKQSNQYGVNAEQLASSGLSRTGYSESSQVNMYNTYQNRVSQARDTYNRAVLEYDNGIKEAQLTNNAALAEIAYNSLQTKLKLGLDQFQYKNQLLQQQLQMQQSISDRYYGRWQDVLKQINTENALAEEKRQFDKQYALSKKAYSSSSRRSSGGATIRSGGGTSKGGTINPSNNQKANTSNNSLADIIKQGANMAANTANMAKIGGKNAGTVMKSKAAKQALALYSVARTKGSLTKAEQNKFERDLSKYAKNMSDTEKIWLDYNVRKNIKTTSTVESWWK